MRLVITNGLLITRSPEDTGFFAQWHVENPPSGALVFKIERSQGPEGPFELVADNIKSYYYYDNNPATPAAPATRVRENFNALSLLRTVYYRVTATASNGVTSTAISDATDELNPRLARLHRKMTRDLSLSLKFNGRDTYVLKRLHWGVRCNACFDLLTKKVTSSKCMQCYGTGFERGYANPVSIKVRYLAPNSDAQMSPQGWANTTRVRAICLKYPLIDPGDVLVDKRDNTRYLVIQQSQTELRKEPVHQSLNVSALAHDSIEYRIAVNKDAVPVIY